jgi:peptidoglycan/xylan/chitin deacetylase (PgdA/CDA1 family)
VRVAFLVGGDTQSTRESIEAVCQLKGVEPVVILVDTHRAPAKLRWKNLFRNISREGVGYLPRRVLSFVREALDGLARRVVPEEEVEALLRQAFPEKIFELKDLERRYGCVVEEVGNLNGPLAAERLRHHRVKLGIVLGTRVLKRHTFSAPEYGSINLHKGQVPRYRGMPPAFWELYEGAAEAGVTVHYVDDGLDTGEVLGSGMVAIHPQETLSSLKRKLDELGSAVLAETVERMAGGQMRGSKQEKGQWPTRTRPTAAQRLELSKRIAGDDEDSDVRRIVKTALHLLLFHGGIWAALRYWRPVRLGRAGIILHHRVNDRSEDRLTTQTRVLCEQLVVLKRYYRVVETSELVERIRRNESVGRGAVAIHFDDCYRDVYQCAGPVLKAAGAPATMFIATGFIDTDRIFEHDRLKYALRFENLKREEVAGLAEYGVAVGAHTVNHVDLGTIEAEQARRELEQSKKDLEEITGREVPFFSFPFGKESNIRPEVRDMVKAAGFQALFSAHGGFVSGESDPYDIKRFGTNSRYRGLDLLMDLEGISLAHLARMLRGR